MEEFELEPGEEVVMTVREHILVFALQLIPLVILAVIPWVLGGLISWFMAANAAANASFASISIPAHIWQFFTGVWLLCVWTAAFGMFTRYYLTVWVITNLRIVDIKQHGFFNREVSSFMLLRVQDVTTDVSGLLATLFGFGRLSVETAGKDEDFHMAGIEHPEAIRDVIMGQVAKLHGTGGSYAAPAALDAGDGV